MDDIAATICRFIGAELKLPASAVTETASLRDLPGMESIKVLRIVARIERAYDVELPDELVSAVETVEELSAAVRELTRPVAPVTQPLGAGDAEASDDPAR
jgi:acyl carrier protein